MTPSVSAILLYSISTFLHLNNPAHWFLRKAGADRWSHDQGDLRLGHPFSVDQEMCMWSGYREKPRDPDRWS